MRKGFKFYRSYYDVAEELNDKDRLAFYDALLKRQFTGVEVELTGLAKFAYISQKHSIDAQVKGYEDKTNTPLIDPMQGGTQGGIEAPSQQVEEKEEEKVKEKIDYEALLQFINVSFNRKFQVFNDKVKSKYSALLKQGYTKNQITNAIKNCKSNQYHKEKNYQYCTPEFFSRTDVIDKYGFDVTDNGNSYTPQIIHE